MRGDAVAAHEEKLVTLGRIVGLFGIQGWVKIQSETRPRENIVRYGPWRVRIGAEWQELKVLAGRRQGPGVVASLEGYPDRDQAARLIGAEIAVPISRLPPLPEGEHYWAELEGLRVVTVAGVALGTVSHLFETGANDVMVVEGDRTRLLPYVPSVIRRVRVDEGVIEVDWDPQD